MTYNFRKNRTALIDCDMVAYRCAGMISSGSGDMADLVDLIPSVISTWAKEAFCSSIVLCKGTKSFRCEVYPEYKANRKDKPKPPMLPEARGVIEHLEWKAKRHNGLEADDIQSILATSDPNKYVIINNDKDMLTVEGVWLYDPDKMDFPEFTNPEDARRNLWIQIMSGDATDNYKGIPKIGPVKANKILDEPRYYDGETTEALSDAWVARHAFLKAGLTEEYFLQMCRCAKLIDNKLWDTTTKTFKLWNPLDE